MAFKIDNPNAPPAVKRLSAREVKVLLDAGKIELFDVRPQAERAQASIGAAKALDEAGQRHLASLPRRAPPSRSTATMASRRAAAEELDPRGLHPGVANLEGGIEAWSRDVDPSVPRY